MFPFLIFLELPKLLRQVREQSRQAKRVSPPPHSTTGSCTSPRSPAGSSPPPRSPAGSSPPPRSPAGSCTSQRSPNPRPQSPADSSPESPPSTVVSVSVVSKYEVICCNTGKPCYNKLAYNEGNHLVPIISMCVSMALCPSYNELRYSEIPVVTKHSTLAHSKKSVI